jgi:small redox-active disulfide protein 2
MCTSKNYTFVCCPLTVKTNQMDIKVLGTGCAKCKSLEMATNQAVEESGIDAIVIKVENFLEIMKLGVMTTPALVIDGKVIVSGRVPSVAEIKEFLIR